MFRFHSVLPYLPSLQTPTVMNHKIPEKVQRKNTSYHGDVVCTTDRTLAVAKQAAAPPEMPSAQRDVSMGTYVQATMHNAANRCEAATLQCVRTGDTNPLTGAP
jgi:hypothetical protein